MPDGAKLRRAKLRGVVSEGMILSESELEIGSGGEGILVLDELTLDAEFAPGTPLGEVLPIAREVLELEITPNRPDCLGVYGVARELHAATGAPLAAAPWAQDPGSHGPAGGRRGGVECPELCPRFTARVFEDVTVGPSPPWLKARLTARRAAPDQQRRRHHQLRDAAHRPAAARLRPRPRRGRAADGAPRASTASRCETLDGADPHARRARWS